LRATVVRVVLWVAVAYFTAFFLLVAGLIGHPSWAEPLVSEGVAKIREVVEDVRSAPGGGGEGGEGGVVAEASGRVLSAATRIFANNMVPLLLLSMPFAGPLFYLLVISVNAWVGAELSALAGVSWSYALLVILSMPYAHVELLAYGVAVSESSILTLRVWRKLLLWRSVRAEKAVAEYAVGVLLAVLLLYLAAVLEARALLGQSG